MGALVLEGGTFRPLFSCGIMDALLDNDIHFPYVIGVSAGISDGVSYVSKQNRRNYDIIMNHRHDKRYLGLRNFFTDRSLFGIKFVYETIPESVFPFDWDAYMQNPAKVVVGVTNAQSGKSEYLDGKTSDKKFTMLKATCALPLMFPAIKMDEKYYYDGGVSDPIPAKKAYDDGNKKMLIILTRPKGYKKELSKANVYASKRLRKKYHEFSKLLLTRHNIYNSEVEYCERLEKEGKALILRPTEEVQIDSLEKDLSKIDKIYRFGYDLAIQNLDKIREIAQG